MGRLVARTAGAYRFKMSLTDDTKKLSSQALTFAESRLEQLTLRIDRIVAQLNRLDSRLKALEGPACEHDWDYIDAISTGDFEGRGSMTLYQCSKCKVVKIG